MSTALPTVTAASITSNGAKAPWDGTANMLDGSAATANVAAGLSGPSDFVDLVIRGMPPPTALSVVSFTFDIRVSATPSS